MSPFKIHSKGIRFLLSLALLYGIVISVSFGQKHEQKTALISTSLGDIHILLHDQTPNHQASFLQLASAGYWDSLTFNRVIPNFVAQAGCPDTEEGFNDPEYLLAPEIHPDLKHAYGAVGAGRDDNPDKNSARCQFYIVQNKDGLARLDGDYTVFGQVIRGMDVVDKIVAAQRDSLDQPLVPIKMKVSMLNK